MRNTTTPEPILTPKEVAARLNVSVGFVYNEMSAGRIRHERLGRVYRIPESALRESFPNLYASRK